MVIKFFSVLFFLTAGLNFFQTTSQAYVSTCAPKILSLVPKGAAQKTLDKLKELDLKKKTLIVVNGLASGGHFYAERARALYGEDINLIHLQSSHRPPPAFNYFQPELYNATLIAPRYSVAQLADSLTRFSNLHIVNGSSNTPKIWPELATSLGVRAVPENIIPTVTHKYHNSKHLKDHGVATITEEVFSNAKKAWAWAQQNLLKGKVTGKIMLKVVSSAAGDGVKVVNNKQEFFEFFSEFLGKKNPLDRKNKEILVQQYVERDEYTEYVINAVADPDHQGKAVITDIMTYTKKVTKHGHIIYLTTRLVHPSEIPEGLWKRFQSIADTQARAYSAKSCVFHTEVFVKTADMTSQSDHPEVLLIETDLRPAGGYIPQLVHASGGIDMVTAHLYSMFEPDKFDQLRQAQRYQFGQHAIQVDLLGPNTPGIVTSIPSLEMFKQKLPGLVDTDLHMKVGQWVAASEDIFFHAGVLNFVGTEEEILKAERRVREWEQSDFYQTRPGNWRENLLYSFRKWRGH